MKNPIYLDYAATTPVDPQVAEIMSQHLTLDGVFGNPASRSHMHGWQAEAAVERARKQVADLINADSREIVWTSGATESDNLAIKGVAEALQEQGRHVVTSLTEHKAVVDTCKWLESRGCEVTWLKPGLSGRIEVEQVMDAVREDTILVSLMHVNNETGVMNDIASIGAHLREKGVLFHVDAAQAAGKCPVDVVAMQVDLLSLSAHKVYGPKGAGALYVRRAPEVRIAAQMHGGGHERGMRSGTLATHQLVGMGQAFEIARLTLAEESQRLTALRDRFLGSMLAVPGVMLNGDPDHRVPGIVNLAFEGVEGESLMLGLHGLAVSSGSACASASMEPSYVLRSMGVGDALAHASLRFSWGRYTTEEDIDVAAMTVTETLGKLRQAARTRTGRAV
ncbi:IscS subfamily cysteine desulfurase [Marinobacteraceae bacterium S3BR75-40.1]